ncbi:hypothetical protein SAMN02745116_02535 [Pilibacter termitis]|uniref:Uncharacterized protein n=1 Tax=Pilibacter termitis TaxID=263852 RepID=A0A1T4RC77_9ENTE|nr:hypothetical protein [Pilibacter termitis]SKA13594.1 hypothetical protein SAMN02745116_02535 [Pilibacter termitis]
MLEIKTLEVDMETGEVNVFKCNTPRDVENLSDDKLQDFLLEARHIQSLMKKGDEEVKKRLDNGHTFSRIGYGNQTRTNLADVESVKKRIVKKYGWNAVVLPSLNQLKRMYGESIEADLEEVIVYKNINVLKVGL